LGSCSPLCGCSYNGFFVIPDIRNDAPAKKIYQGVVEVLEGNISANQLENEFTQWARVSCTRRWYAKPISTKKFLMCFPSSRDIVAWVHFGRTNLRTVQNVVVKVTHWFPGYGDSGDLDIAWFQVKGIPLDNRKYLVVVYAGSTVGRTLVIDRHSLNNVEYVRIQIGSQRKLQCLLSTLTRADQILTGLLMLAILPRGLDWIILVIVGMLAISLLLEDL
jgi:hypothetical protein